MKIDEAIASARNIAKEQRYYANFEKGLMHSVCINNAENNEQLAEWLEELKEARKGFEENRKAGYKHGYSDGYAKAIDEFSERLKAEHEGLITNLGVPYAITFEKIDEIAEEMRGGK